MPFEPDVFGNASSPKWSNASRSRNATSAHSTTVAGVANTWGYGAMTNSYTDIRNAKTMIIMGGNPAEAHPVSMQHVLSGKELNRANLIVIDPRFTRTAAHATEYVRLRPGTDIPLIWGMLWHVFENGWEVLAAEERTTYRYGGKKLAWEVAAAKVDR